MSNLINIDEKNFQTDVIDSPVPVLVIFWAPWCMPCRLVSPLIDKLAKQYQGKLKFCRVNTEASMELAIKEEIATIPAFKIYRGGKVAAETIGNMPENELIAFIDKALFSTE